LEEVNYEEVKEIELDGERFSKCEERDGDQNKNQLRKIKESIVSHGLHDIEQE
jgi:hypothetical protein